MQGITWFRNRRDIVIPAQAGIQTTGVNRGSQDSRLRGNDRILNGFALRPPHPARRIAYGPHWRAFTLIEMLASTLLMVMLTSAILTSLKSSFDETRRLQAEQSRYPSLGLLEEQIRRDVQNAQGMQASPNSLQLYGHLACDGPTRMPTLKRALVSYQVRSVARRSVLIREELSVGDLVPSLPRREVVWEGVSGLTVTSLGRTIIIGEKSGSEQSTETGGLPVIPPAVRIVIVDDHRRPLLAETVLHHQQL